MFVGESDLYSQNPADRTFCGCLCSTKVVKVLILCSILDGRLRKRERIFYEATVEACGFANNQQRVKQMARKFRVMQPITLTDFAEVTDMPPLPATIGYYLGECKSACMLVLAC